MKYSKELKKELKSFGYEPEELDEMGWEIFLNTFQNMKKEELNDFRFIVLHHLVQEVKKIIISNLKEVTE
nr:MAG TPA: hypothetical protein [Caudoviricetes sp.]